MINCIRPSRGLNQLFYYLCSANKKLLNPSSISSLLHDNHSENRLFTTLQPKVGVINTHFNKLTLYRQKSHRKRTGSKQDDDSDSDCSDEEEEEDEECVKTKGTEIKTYGVQTLRTDSIIKNILGYKRKRVEEAFYKKKIRINGKTLLKKSLKANIGDVIDLIIKVAPENPKFIYVGRVEILSMKPDPDSDNIFLKVQKTKSLLIENYPGGDSWKHEEPELSL